jgi:hypothetical protein
MEHLVSNLDPSLNSGQNVLRPGRPKLPPQLRVPRPAQMRLQRVPRDFNARLRHQETPLSARVPRLYRGARGPYCSEVPTLGCAVIDTDTRRNMRLSPESRTRYGDDLAVCHPVSASADLCHLPIPLRSPLTGMSRRRPSPAPIRAGGPTATIRAVNVAHQMADEWSRITWRTVASADCRSGYVVKSFCTALKPPASPTAGAFRAGMRPPAGPALRRAHALVSPTPKDSPSLPAQGGQPRNPRRQAMRPSVIGFESKAASDW